MIRKNRVDGALLWYDGSIMTKAAVEPKTETLTHEEFDTILALGCCPKCMTSGQVTPRLVKRMRVRTDEDGTPRFQGCYYECPVGGWRHYHLSPGGARSKPRQVRY